MIIGKKVTKTRNRRGRKANLPNNEKKERRSKKANLK